MRNLKRILSAALAMVMSLSIATVASAAVDFKDAEDINYDEAVAVMSTIGVLEGYNGEFDPAGSLTREQAAKIIAYMLLGDNANKLSVSESRYKDVAANRWSAGVIEYCSEMGILAGNGDGTYNPEGKLTGYAFAKMLLGALGYKADIEGFTGAAWTLNVANYAMQIGLDDGIEDIDWSANITREQAAQMAMNAVKSPLVQYKNGSTIIIDGEKVTFGSGDAYYVTTTLAKEQRISTKKLSNTNEYTVEFGEKYFPGLRMTAGVDDYARPAHTWTYNTEEIGTYVDYTNLVETYTTGVKGKELYELLTASTIKEYDLVYYVDGADASQNGLTNIIKTDLYRTNNRTAGMTGKGVLTEVFVDHDNEVITITSINTYLAKANADYNTKSESISLQVFDNSNGTTKIVDVDEVPGIADLKEGDFVLVKWASDTPSAVSKEVVKISEVAEVMSDVEVSKFSKNTNDDSYGQSNTDRVTALTVDGEKYDASRQAFYEYATLGDYNGDLLTNKTYDIYMDEYGYFIGAALHSGDDQYLFITAYDLNNSAQGTRNADATAIFTDGTMKEIKVNTKDTNTNIGTTAGYTQWKKSNQDNRWYTYTENDGVYTLDPVDRWTYTANNTGKDVVVRTDNLALSPDLGTGRSFANEDSIFITVEDETTPSAGTNSKVIDEVTGMYTGVQSVNLTYAPNDWVMAVYNRDNYIIAAIVLGEAEGAIDNFAYILSGANSEGRDADGNYYWTFDAVLNGTIQEMTIKSKYTNTVNNLKPDTVQELVLDGDNYVTKINDVDKVYTNTNLNSPVTGFDVYDVAGNSTTLFLEGRTLHLETRWDAYGLFFASDAKAVVSQVVNGSRDEIEYASVKEAYSTLADANGKATDGLQYDGRVVAVLDANGVAKWVFFYDNTPVNSGNIPDYGNNGKVKTMTYTAANNELFVADANGNAVANARVSIEQLMPYGYVTVGTFVTGADGKIIVPAVTGGTYRAVCGDVQYIFAK